MTKPEIRKLDAMFQEVTQEIGMCELSGHPSTVTHHFITRSNMAVRWYIPNAIPLSHDKHMWAHANPAEFKKKLIEKKGKIWYNTLIRESNRIAKYLQYDTVVDHLHGNTAHYL